MATNIIRIVLIIIAVALIFLIQLQSGKADGLSSSIMGTNKELSLFSNSKAKGSDLVLQRATTILVIAFFTLVIVLQMV